ncbi:MAG: MG2 domain-containing protein [Myxococcota bacterium]
MTRLACLVSVLALPAVAQDFDTPNRQLQEKSHSRACDGFTAFVKANPSSPLAREASAKKAAACLMAGKGSYDELRKLAKEGEKDFGRAYAAFILFERGELQFSAVSPLLKQAASGDDRVAKEARALLVRGGFVEMERNLWDPARLTSASEIVLEYAATDTERARAKFLRSRQRFQQGGKDAPAAEKELQSVGDGNTEWADDALYVIAERREGEGKYEAALTIYDGIVKRFSDVTSNMKSSAKSRADEIRRPSISLSIPYNELPGVKPQVTVSWRNVKNARWTLHRVNPLAAPDGAYPDDPDDLLAAATSVASSWTSTLDVPVRHAPGSRTFDATVTEPGAYVLVVEADGQRSSAWLLVTQLALVTKTDAKRLYVYAADVETGEAKPNAEVSVFLYRSSSSHQKLTGKTGADGVARFDVTGAETSMLVWAKSGSFFAGAPAGNAYHSSWSKEYLAYVMTDRPLYKPGETVGFKLFLRTREGGPSTPVSDAKLKLRISDPQGKTIAEPELTTNAFGTAQFSLPLAKNAPLGAWSMYISTSNYSWRQNGQSFRVEEYKPPEYTVSAEPLGNPKPGDKVKVKVKAAFYSGGPVANAQGRAIVTITPYAHQFGPWPDAKLEGEGGFVPYGSGDYDEEYDYRYRRGYRPYYGALATHTVTFKTGSDGTAEVELPPAPEGYDSVQYSLQLFVTDSSRREITGTGSIKMSKEPYFVDVRTSRFLYRPGEKVTVDLRGEDPNGRPASPDVIVRLMRITEDGKTSRIAETRSKLKDGAGRVVLDADALGMARVEVLDGSTEKEKVLASSDFWLTSDSKPIPPPGGGFQLLTDSAPLKAGDLLRVLVATNKPGGHVVLSIESESVHELRVVELKGRARFVELPLRADMAPNAWLLATRFEDTQYQQQQRPIRIAGSEVQLAVNVDFGRAAAEPGSKVAPAVVATGAPAGTNMEVALTVVDESLFAIEPERKDFLAFFGRTPRQLYARTSFSHYQRGYRPRPAPQPIVAAKQPLPEPTDSVNEDDRGEAKKDSAASRSAGLSLADAPASAAPAPPMAEKSAKRLSRDQAAEEEASGPGGGARQGEPPVKVRADFATSAGWFPALTGKLGTRLTQPLSLKDSLTSWKATATVVTPGPHLGQGAGSIRAAKALMVRLQAPRFFVEGDEVTLSAVVESHLPKAADIDVTLSAPGFKPLSDPRRVVRVEPEQTLRVDAKFKVVELGERTIRAVVKGGGTADAMEWKLPAFVHGSAQRQFFAGRLGDTFGFEFELPEKRKAALTRLELNLSPSLLAVMFDGLPFLAQYPYGCVEQTLSRFVPATIARRAVHDLKLPASRVPADLDDMVEKGLARLYDFQHGDGAWGWWKDDRSNLWMTAYVVYALSLAREAGVNVNVDVLKRGRAWLTSHLGEALNTPETHAFMVYALAATGGAPKPALDKVFERRTSLTPRARAQLALALLHSTDKRARIAVENLDDVVKAASARPDAAVGDATTAWSTSAAIEATAFTLMAYSRYDLKSPLIAPLTDFLVLRRNGGKWRTTRDTAFAIYALADLARREGAAASSGTFVVSINGREVKRLKYDKGGLDLTEPLVLTDKDLKAGKNVVSVKRDGRGTGYFAGTFDVFNMNDFIKGVGGDVKVKRTYTLLGRPSAEKAQAPTEYGMPVESGVRVRVDVEITANKAVEYVMLEDLKPAGFEAVELRSGPQVCNYACAHAELRTDRVAMFLPELSVGTTKLSYELRAEVPGRFAALPARVEAMYAPEIQATADEMRFEVRDAPESDVAQKQ